MDGFSAKRLTRLRGLLERRVDAGFVPGLVVVLARHGQVQKAHAGDQRLPLWSDFWTTIYQAID